MVKVLVIDDDRDTVDSLSALLRVNKYKAFAAYNGSEALEVAAAVRPRFIVLDIAMPGLSGLNVCRRLRGESWGKETVIIAVSGWTREEDKRAAQEAGCDYYLLKPVAVETLLELFTSLSPDSGNAEDRRYEAVDSGRSE